MVFPVRTLTSTPAEAFGRNLKSRSANKYLFRIWLLFTDTVENTHLFHVSTFSPGAPKLFSFGGPQSQTSCLTTCQKRACYYDCIVEVQIWYTQETKKFYVYDWRTCANIFVYVLFSFPVFSGLMYCCGPSEGWHVHSCCPPCSNFEVA